MKIIAIDTSMQRGSIALLSRDRCLDALFFDGKDNHIALLPNALHQAMTENSWNYHEVDLIVLTIGPGSFAGLRIALSLVKGLAMIHHTPVVAIPTLTAMAALSISCQTSLKEWIMPGPTPATRLVLALANARLGELFAALYQCGSRCDQVFPELVWPPARWLPVDLASSIQDKLRQGHDHQEEIVVEVVGDGIPIVIDAFQPLMADNLFFMPHITHVDPIILGILGKEWYKRYGGVEILTLEPLYLRRSSAETLHKNG